MANYFNILIVILSIALQITVSVYTGCGDYICGGYKRSENRDEWEDCISDNELYNPEHFDTNSFCTYCSVEDDGAGPCYCATKSECYSWWYGCGITMIVIGLIATTLICRQLFKSMSSAYKSIYNDNKDATMEENDENEETVPIETECDRCGSTDHISTECPHYSQSRPKPFGIESKPLSNRQLFMKEMKWSQIVLAVFCLAVLIGGIVLVSLAATNTGY